MIITIIIARSDLSNVHEQLLTNRSRAVREQTTRTLYMSTWGSSARAGGDDWSVYYKRRESLQHVADFDFDVEINDRESLQHVADVYLNVEIDQCLFISAPAPEATTGACTTTRSRGQAPAGRRESNDNTTNNSHRHNHNSSHIINSNSNSNDTNNNAYM